MTTHQPKSASAADHAELTWLFYSGLAAYFVFAINAIAFDSDPFTADFIGFLLCAVWAALLFRASEHSFRAQANGEGWSLVLLVLVFIGATGAFLWRITDIIRLEA